MKGWSGQVQGEVRLCLDPVKPSLFVSGIFSSRQSTSTSACLVSVWLMPSVGTCEGAMFIFLYQEILV